MPKFKHAPRQLAGGVRVCNHFNFSVFFVLHFNDSLFRRNSIIATRVAPYCGQRHPIIPTKRKMQFLFSVLMARMPSVFPNRELRGFLKKPAPSCTRRQLRFRERL